MPTQFGFSGVQRTLGEKQFCYKERSEEKYSVQRPLGRKILCVRAPSGRKVLGVKGLRATEKVCEGLAATSADVISGVLFLAEEQGLGLLLTELFSQVTTESGREEICVVLPPPSPPQFQC